MIIEIPDDLTLCSEPDLLELSSRMLATATAANLELCSRSGKVPADRPAWASKLGAVLDARRNGRSGIGPVQFGLAFAFMLLMSLPSLLPACHGFAAKFQAAQQTLDVKPEQWTQRP